MAEAAKEASTAAAGAPGRATLRALVIAATGVVYGDIGTSPLYAVRECFIGEHGVAPEPGNVYGACSLIFWALALVISFKYMLFITRADNRGEGGIFALFSLLPGPGQGISPRTHRWLLVAGIFGAALLYGDGVITPAISVMSAVEGLRVATTALDHAVIPITVLILLGLFLAQRAGTGRIGRVFGPIVLAWFGAISLTGLASIAGTPAILGAVNPVHGITYLAEGGGRAFLTLGAVVLCITGGEALYADMGHFGRRPIWLSWTLIAWPALTINYFGQGAYVLRHPELAHQAFYGLVPQVLLIPMVLLATTAACIASQAMISGTYSLTRSAIQLGLLPRMRIVHTSASTEGQIYMPAINAAMMVACIALVLGFRSSSGLAGAYGLAVTGQMAITSVLFYFVARRSWGWPPGSMKALVLLFLVVDLGFLSSTLPKLPAGGWFPLGLAVLVAAIMTTWKAGRRLLALRLRSVVLPLDHLLADIAANKVQRVPGNAVFMASSPEGAPPVLLHHVKHNKVLHEKVVLLTIRPVNEPRVPPTEAIRTEDLGQGFHRVIVDFGFMQSPDMRRITELARWHGLDLPLERTSFYLGRETLLIGKSPTLRAWRKRLFGLLSRNSIPPTLFFNIPPDRVMEIGMQVEL